MIPASSESHEINDNIPSARHHRPPAILHPGVCVHCLEYYQEFLVFDESSDVTTEIRIMPDDPRDLIIGNYQVIYR